MSRWVSRIRRPVRREGVELYLLLMLLSFGGSVAFTRLFLELTGYPQLGGGSIHIAHVLWGGLLLYLASLLPLILANRWVYVAGAVLAGIGVGLFIDEVGKFITQTNNYFEPLAAPIVYAFFLLSVLLYFRVSRPVPQEPRAELYQVLEAMEEVLDHDLDARERQELELRLKGVAQDDQHPAFSRLARELLEFLRSDQLRLAPGPGRLQRWLQQVSRFDERCGPACGPAWPVDWLPWEPTGVPTRPDCFWGASPRRGWRRSSRSWWRWVGCLASAAWICSHSSWFWKGRWAP
jgi:hypothetical protein